MCLALCAYELQRSVITESELSDGMREPADILSCEFSLLNCDFDRAAKKAVDALRAQRYSDSLNHPNF